MDLYIPTYQRSDYNLADTLRHWPQGLLVEAVVQPQEVDAYLALTKRLNNTGIMLRALPKGVYGIANTREYIRSLPGSRYFCMIDDDLGFLARNRPDHPIYLGKATPQDIKVMFRTMQSVLQERGYAHCAVSMREGNNRVVKDYVDSTRGIRVVAYNRAILDQHHLHFRPEVEGREDLDMTLQLLRLGYPNRVFYRWAQGQRSSNSPGGLSATGARAPAELTRSAQRLAELHPGLVRVIQKTTKTSWDGMTRTDVNVKWKKALEQGEAVHGAQFSHR